MNVKRAHLQMSLSIQDSSSPGSIPTWRSNKPKNRYANVIAYDHSRVILAPIEGITGSDYINANYIDGYRKQNAYIATQGPLPETFGDFWRMVWEQRSATVVMMTRLEEKSRRLANSKAHTSRFISANLPCNKFKNRLVNIMPYETTRVCLQPIRGLEGSDYINASFIDGYRQQKAYIATQGPLAETTEDFWRMLWENNSTIVVMLTKLREMGREKCHQYWPAERSARYQYFVVDPMAEYNMPQYILREFKVTDARDGQSRTVRQFQFTDWPEQGVPKSGEGFIDFIGQVHKTKEQFGQDGPISVHCSAGVGRTGVFITLSIVLERMRYEGVVDIFQTVKMLRTQRPAMVQTEDEYQFCYQAALEYLGSFDHYAT
ncbi:hypothetical protein SRHO_G00174540 [Serrasalmus rhombeus]